MQVWTLWKRQMLLAFISVGILVKPSGFLHISRSRKTVPKFVLFSCKKEIFPHFHVQKATLNLTSSLWAVFFDLYLESLQLRNCLLLSLKIYFTVNVTQYSKRRVFKPIIEVQCNLDVADIRPNFFPYCDEIFFQLFYWLSCFHWIFPSSSPPVCKKHISFRQSSICLYI